MNRRIFGLLSVLLAAGLLLAACAPAAPTPAATQPPTVEATQPPTTAATSAPTQPPAAEPQELVVGFTASLTGAQEVSSKRQVNGLDLWMQQVNDAGGITLSDGTVVTFASKFYDDESATERVQELYTRLVTEDNADFLISPYSSGLTAAAAVIAEQNGKVMITTGAADDATYKQGYTNIFQLYTPGSQYFLSTVDLLKTLEPDAQIGIAHENDKFSTSVIDGLAPYLESQGFQLALEPEGYATETTDFGPIINKISSSAATVLLGGGHYPDGSTLARQLSEKGVALNFIGLLVAPADSKFSELGDGAVGITAPSQWEGKATHTQAEADALGIEWFGPTGEEFSSAYEAAYGDPPTYHAAGGYAAGLILQKAIEAADSVDPAEVKAALEAMDLYTFFGGTKFDTTPEAHGLQTGHSMVVIQWQKNEAGELERQVIWPADVATADPLYPIP